jgi:hypothetical protein
MARSSPSRGGKLRGVGGPRGFASYREAAEPRRFVALDTV